VLDGLTICNSVVIILFVVRRDFSTDICGLMNPGHSNADNMNNIRREASRHFRNKERHI
jgi:hypothetical protein